MEINVFGFNQEYDNNIKRRSIFEGTTLHNFNKSCWQTYLNSPSLVTQQFINCSMGFSNLHKKHQTKPNVHFMINYIRKDNEKLKIM